MSLAADPELRRPSVRAPYHLWSLLALLAAGVAALAYQSHRVQERALEDEVRSHLLSIADMKVQQLAAWQSRRVRRARTIMANGMSQNEMARLVGSPGGTRGESVLVWLKALAAELEAANVILTDARGRIVLSTGRLFGDAEHIRQRASQAIDADDVVLSDFHRDPATGSIHLGMNFPLRSAGKPGPFGVLLLGFDPNRDLYPLLGAWPVASRSAETLLVRRDGDGMLFLNEVRHRKDSAMKLRIPLSLKDVPAVRAADGYEGSLEGPDYRGTPVFAAVRRVPDTPWIVVAKVDSAEVRAPLLQRSLLLGMLAISLILAAGAVAAYLWRREQLQFYRSQFEAAAERRALIGHYDYLSRFANDIILLVGPEGRIVEANDRAVAVYGYTRDELQRMSVRDLRHPSQLPGYERQFSQVAERGSLVFETTHQSRDGRAIPVEVSARLIEVGGRLFRQSIIRDISERKAADQELHQTLATLRTVIDASPAAIVTATVDQVVTSWNPAAERIFGWKSVEVVGKPLQVSPEDRRENLVRMVGIILGGGTITDYPGIGLSKEGVRIPLSLSAAPLHDADGKVTGAIAILLDLTSHHQTLAALAESESRFRGTFEQSTVGMNHTDLDGRFLRVNQRFCELTGYSAEEMLQLNFRDITHPDDLAGNLDRARDLATGRVAGFTVQKRYIRKDRSFIWVQVTVSLLHPPSGDAPYFFVVAEDITERLRAEDALRRSEERFRQVVENAPAGIIVEVAGRIRYLNPAAQRMLGTTTADQLVDRCILDLIHPDERVRAQARSDRVNRGEAVPLTERSYIRLDGQHLPACVSASPIEYDQQRAGLVFFHDLTERKRAEVERATLEEQLRQSQKMEGVGRLAGGVAHDFNNHLTVINGYCDMLLGDLAADNPARDGLEEIRAAGHRAAALTQQLLTFSRKQIISLKAVSLNDVVDEAGKMLRRLIGEDVAIQTHLAPELRPVMADRGQMNQVIVNLAVNARDAMPGGGTLMIETSNLEIGETSAGLFPEAMPGSYVVLTVTDTGIGMSPETMERVFEPFYTTKARNAGTGLGLSTVYGIVQQSGGLIRVASQPGQGATFRIYLPVTEQAAEADPQSLPDSRMVKGTETVLVVEDQVVVRKLALSILRKCGYRLLEAADGVEALSLAEQYDGPIDLLMTDVIMPGVTGRELADRLVALRPDMRVLYFSGYTADVLGRHGVLDPGVSYLPKPFSPAGLSAKVREVLGSPRSVGRVLVIDDEDSVRSWLHQVLSAAGHEVLTASNGKDGVRLMKDHKFNVVITDLVMPEQEGLETVRILHRKYPEVPVIAISGAFGGDFLKTARLLGAQVAFAKPIDARVLLESVRELIGHARHVPA